MMRQMLVALMVSLGSFALADNVTISQLGSAQANYDVSVQVGNSCALTTTDGHFGHYDGAALTTSATVSVSCSTGAQYTLLVTSSSVDSFGNPVLQRDGGSETLEYALDSVTDNSQYTALDASDPLGSVTVTANGNTYVRSLNFLLFDGQTTAPGTYRATHTAEITLLN